MARFVSRKEALDIAVDLCKTNKTPNVLPTLKFLKFGLMGLTISGESVKEEQLCFPLFRPATCIEALPLRQIRVEDRMSFMEFFDLHPEALAYLESETNVAYVVDILGGAVFTTVPGALLNTSHSMQHLCSKWDKQADKTTKEILIEITNRAYALPPVNKVVEDPQPEPIKYIFRTPATELRITDRVDFIKFFDDMFGTEQARIARLKSTNDVLLISRESSAYAFVPDQLIKSHNSIRTILDTKFENCQPYYVEEDSFIN